MAGIYTYTHTCYMLHLHGPYPVPSTQSRAEGVRIQYYSTYIPEYEYLGALALDWYLCSRGWMVASLLFNSFFLVFFLRFNDMLFIPSPLLALALAFLIVVAPCFRFRFCSCLCSCPSVVLVLVSGLSLEFSLRRVGYALCRWVPVGAPVLPIRGFWIGLWCCLYRYSHTMYSYVYVTVFLPFSLCFATARLVVVPAAVSRSRCLDCNFVQIFNKGHKPPKLEFQSSLRFLDRGDPVAERPYLCRTRSTSCTAFKFEFSPCAAAAPARVSDGQVEHLGPWLPPTSSPALTRLLAKNPSFPLATGHGKHGTWNNGRRPRNPHYVALRATALNQSGRFRLPAGAVLSLAMAVLGLRSTIGHDPRSTIHARPAL
ncbi:hypothetical protein DENSPDRAFT_446623 [Dentipellis sp. KUC8613]|nr:hypothetical protein DENSPDRAFT_446623 [Dentipellis sp. KUC8613]